MSDSVVKSGTVKDKIPEKFMQSHQSIWMSHWTNSSYRPVNDTRNQLSHHYESGEDSHRAEHHHLLGGPEIETESSKFVKESREMHKKSFMKENSETSFKHLRHETFKGQHFPMFKSPHNRGGILSLKNVESSNHHEGILRSQIAPSPGCGFPLGITDNHLPSMLEGAGSKIDRQSIESYFKSGGTTSNPAQQVKSNKLLENNGIAFSAPLEYEVLGSTSRIRPSEFNSERTPTESFFHDQGCTDQPSITFFADETKMNSNAALLMHNPSTSDNHLRDFVDGQFQKMPNNSNSKLFPDQIKSPEASLHHQSYEPPRIPPSVHDVKTMNICTTIDSVKEFSTAHSKFSQTTHFLFTKKTDVNLPNGGQIFRKSLISSKIEGKPMSDFLRLSTDFGLNVKQGVKLQTLDSSSDNEGKADIENVQTLAVDLKKESSAETDAMDMDALQENRLFGVALSLSNKDIEVAEKAPTFHAAVASEREESRGRLPNTELPDINQELPVISGVANSADDAETSISRTQSLDVQHFLSYAEHPTYSKSGASADGLLRLDPCSRWVKRLKPSASEPSAHGTKSSRMGEASSHEKVDKFFSKMLKCTKTGSDPKIGNSYGKKQMVIDQNAELPRNAESSSTESVMKSQDTTLSHAWIRRWCHNTSSSKKKPEAVVICEPQSSKATVSSFQKKQFPSIAALALMGKAMTGFPSCEFRKRGSLVLGKDKDPVS